MRFAFLLLTLVCSAGFSENARPTYTFDRILTTQFQGVSSSIDCRVEVTQNKITAVDKFTYMKRSGSDASRVRQTVFQPVPGITVDTFSILSKLGDQVLSAPTVSRLTRPENYVTMEFWVQKGADKAIIADEVNELNQQAKVAQVDDEVSAQISTFMIAQCDK